MNSLISQELVVMNKFKRSLGWFVTLLQFGGYTFYAWLQRMYSTRSTARPKVPVWCYVILSVLQVKKTHTQCVLFAFPRVWHDTI